MAGSVSKFRKEAFNTLVETYGQEQYDISEEEFNRRMDSEPAFADETYTNLKEAYNGKPPYSTVDFKKKVGAKAIAPTSTGGLEPSPSQAGGVPLIEKTTSKVSGGLARAIGMFSPSMVKDPARMDALKNHLVKSGYSQQEIDLLEKKAQQGVKQRETPAQTKQDEKAKQQEERQRQVAMPDTPVAVRDVTTQKTVMVPTEDVNVVSAQRKKLQEDAFNTAYQVFENNAIKYKPEADPANKGKFVYVKDEGTGQYKKVTYDEKYQLAPSNDPTYGKMVDKKKLEEIVELTGQKYKLSGYEKTQLRKSIESTWESKPSSLKAQIGADMKFAEKYGVAPGMVAMESKKREKELQALQENLTIGLESDLDKMNQEAKVETDQLSTDFETSMSILQNKYQGLVNSGQMDGEQANMMFKNEYDSLVRGMGELQQGIQTRYAKRFNAAKLAAENYFADQVGSQLKGMNDQQKRFYTEAYRSSYKAAESDRLKNLEYMFRNKGYGDQIVTAFNAGVVDLYSSIGGFLGYVGLEDANYKMTKAADQVYQGLGPMVTNMESIFDASWWISNGVRSAPMMMALAPVGMAGSGISANIARLVTSSKKYQNLSGLLGGGVVAHRAETFLEQGGSFNDAIAQGKSVEEASQIAADVGTYNLATYPLQLLQMMPMFKYLDDGIGGALGMAGGATEEIIQGYASAKAVANQEGRDFTFTEYIQTEEAAVSGLLGAAFEATPYILHGQLANLSEKADLNTQIGTIQNMIEGGSYSQAAAAVDIAYLNSAIDEKTKNTLNLIINASSKAVEQTANVDNDMLRQAANNSLIEAEYYRQQAKMSRGTVAEALTQKAMMAEQDAAAIISGDAPVMAITRKGDKAPTIMTPEMMQGYLAYDNIIEGIVNGEINVVIRNNPEMEELLKDRIYNVNYSKIVRPAKDALLNQDYSSESIAKLNDQEAYFFPINKEDALKNQEFLDQFEVVDDYTSLTGKEGISKELSRLKEQLTGKLSSKRKDIVDYNMPGWAVKEFASKMTGEQQAAQSAEQTQGQPTQTQPKPAGETISFKPSINEAEMQGTKVTIPGFEDVDFVMTQDGMSYDIRELATGKALASLDAFTPEEAASKAAEVLSGKFKDSDDLLSKIQRKIDQGKTGEGYSAVNKSEAYDRFQAKQKGEYEALPFVHSDEERNALMEVANEAKSKGLDSAATMIENAANAKQGKYFGQKMPLEKAKEILANAENTENLKQAKKKGEPYQGADKETFAKGETAFATLINYGLSSDRYGSLSRDVREKALNAWNQLADIKNKYGYLPDAIREKLETTPEIIAGLIAKVPFQKSLSEAEKKQETKKLKADLDKMAKTIDQIHSNEFPKEADKKDIMPNQIVDDETRVLLEEAGTQYTYNPQNDEEIMAALANGDRVFGVNEIDGEVEEIFSVENARKNLGEIRVLPKEVEASIKGSKEKEYEKTPVDQYGNSDYVEFTDIVKQKFTYKVIEIDQAIPSHVSGGVRNPAHTISLGQPKERGDIGSKMARDKIATEPNFKLLGQNNFAYYGSPVVNQRNEVIQGNNRTMGLKMHYDIVKGDTYKQDLIANAESFGIDPDVVAKMDKPILVREANVNDLRAIELGNYKAEDIETGGKQRIDAIVTSRKLSIRDKKILSDLVFSDEYETPAEAIRRNVPKMKEIFKRNLNLSQFLTAFDDTGITRSGSEDLQAVMNQFMFDGGQANLPQLFDTLPATIRTGLQKSLKNIFDTPVNKAILPEVQQSIAMLADFYGSGQSDFKTWLKTIDMFTGKTPAEAFGPEVTAISNMIESAEKAKDIPLVFAQYADKVKDKEADLLGPAQEGMSKQQAMQEAFGVEAKAAEKPSTKPQTSLDVLKSFYDSLPRKEKERRAKENRDILLPYYNQNIREDLVDKFQEDSLEVQAIDKFVVDFIINQELELNDAWNQFVDWMKNTYPNPKDKIHKVIQDITVNDKNFVRIIDKLDTINQITIAKERALMYEDLGIEFTESISTPPTTPTKPATKPMSEEEKRIRDEIKKAGKDIFGSGELYTGLDPEKLAKVAWFVGQYIKLGYVKFNEVLDKFFEDFGKNIKNFISGIKEAYLLYWNSAPDDVADSMDDPATVRKFKYEESAQAPDVETGPIEVPTETAEQSFKKQFRQAVKEAIETEPKMNIIRLRSLAKEIGYDANDTQLQEQVEAAVYELGREVVVASKGDNQAALKELMRIYENQPTISMRSSERVEKQQYSTPIPYSFLADMFISDSAKSVLEPSAGNGFLTVKFDPKNVIVNEIDSERLANLEENGYRDVLNQDALSSFDIPLVDAVVMNPPFGPLPEAIKVDGYTIKKLDHAMAINALNRMAPNGTASIIIGGHNQFDADGMMSNEGDRVFFNYLFAKYNVSGVLNIAGDMYAKQGTTFPTRLILISGRRPEGAQKLIPNKNNPLTPDLDNRINDWAELYNAILNKKAQNEEANLQSDLDEGLPNNQDVIGGVGTGIIKQGGASVESTPKDKGPDQRGAGEQFGGKRTDTGRVGVGTTPASGGKSGRDGGGDSGFGGFSDTTIKFPDEQPGQAAEDLRRKNPSRDLRTGDASRLPSKLTADELLKEKAPYKPVSKAPAVGSIIPTTMALDVEQALLKLEQRVGPLDDYVMDRLDYDSIEDLYKAFSAEQVDAIAMAVDQIEQDGGFIIGDMTGIGKGRIAAGVIRYSIKNGLMPIFFTERANLFTDLYRDLVDIGFSKINPFIVNSKGGEDPDIYAMDDDTPDRKPVYKTQSKQEKEAEYSGGSVSSAYNVILATYSQYQTKPKSMSDVNKHNWMLSSGNGAVVILDEAHNATGDGIKGNRFTFMTRLLENSKAATFLSATFAKNPTSLPLYATKTAMQDAGLDNEQLIEAIKNGGVALQEIISSGLVQAGQMIRRERDFTGVKISYDVIAPIGSEADKQVRDKVDKFTDIMRNMIDFQRTYISPAIDAAKNDPESPINKARIRRGINDLGIRNTPFSSKVFNVVNQLLLSSKADATADMAIEELKKGNKPVISLMNTMESFLTDLVQQEEDAGITETAPIANPDLSLVLMRGINSMFKITVTNEFGDSVPAMLPEKYLSDEGKKQLAYLRSKIRNASSGLSLSPLDTILQKVRDAGYNIVELTGRKNILEFQPDGTAIMKTRGGKEETDTTTVVKNFNSGKIDALLFNKTSGISLHASSKFADKKPRVMITPQLRLNISDEVQARGRVDRTGQVHRGSYRYPISTIPAETRLMLMFQSKMKSLDASTTTSQKNKIADTGYNDFLNKYGDTVVHEYLLENPTMAAKLMLDNIPEKASGGFARAVSGQVAILSTQDQETFYNDIADRYKDVIEFLNENGANDLEVKTLPLSATLLDQETAVVGEGTNTAFGIDTYIEKSEVNVLKKPLRLEEVNKIIDKNLNGKEPAQYKQDNINLIDENYNQFSAEKLEFVKESWKQRVALRIEKLENEGKSEEEIKEERADYEERANIAYLNEAARIEQVQQAILGKVRYFSTGRVYMVPLSVTGEAALGISRGVFLGFDIKKNPTSLYTKGQIKAKFAVADGRRTVSIPLSMDIFIDSVISNTSSLFSDSDDTMKIENWDKTIPNRTRETRYFVTGNLLQAFEDSNLKGQLVRFTDDKGSVRDGILLPPGYRRDQSSTVTVPADKAIQWMVENNKDYQIELNGADVVISYFKDSKTLEVRVPSSKKDGGKFYLDKDLRALVINNNFAQRGGSFRATVPNENIKAFGKLLSDKFKGSVNIIASAYNIKDKGKQDDAQKRYDNAKAQVRKLFKGKPGQALGFAYDPRQAAQEMYDKHVALVNLAKAAINVGVTKFGKFVSENNLRAEKWTKRAWDDAEGQLNGAPPMFSGPDAMMDEAINRVENVFTKQDELKNEKQSSFKKLTKKVRDVFVRDLFGERRYDLQRRLFKEGGQMAYMYLANTAGAGAAAREFIKNKTESIIGGLKAGEINFLNRLVQVRRTMQIEEIYEQRRKDELQARIADFTNQNNNTPPSQAQISAMEKAIALEMKTPMNPDGTTAAEFEAWMEDKRASDPELFVKVNERATMFFEAMNELLLKRLESKRISVDTYDKLSQYDYSRRAFVQHFLVDSEGFINSLPKGAKGLAGQDMYSLDEGSENLLLNDTMFLLQLAAVSTYYVTANNLALLELDKFAKDKDPDWVKQWSYSKEAPSGFTKFVFYENDKQKAIIMADEFAQMWAPRQPMVNPAITGLAQLISQGPVLRFMATGAGNSFFFLTNFPRDFVQTLMFTNTYSPNLLKAVPQFTVDMLATLKDTAFRKGEYLNAVEQGMLMDFLSSQGNPFFTSDKPLLSKAEQAWDDLSSFMGYLNTTTELMPRMAIRRRHILNLTAKFYLDNGRAPLPDEKDQIEAEATFYARNYMDFATGPNLTKEADKALPYLNAMTIGVKNAVTYTIENPKDFSIKSVQVMAFAASLFAYALANYEDEMEEDVSTDIKNRFHVIPLPYQRRDENGNVVRDIVTIPKNQQMAPYYAFAEELVRYQMTGKFDYERINQAAKYAGYHPERLVPGYNWVGSVPAFAAWLAINHNVEQVIGTGETRQIFKSYEAMSEKEKYDPDKTRKFFIDLGALLDKSPQQLQVGAGKVLTDVESNIWTNALLNTYDAVTGGMTHSEKLDYGDAVYGGMKEFLGAPMKRVLKTTRPGVNTRKTDEAYEILKKQGDMSIQEKRKIKQDIKDIMFSTSDKEVIITDKALMKKYKRARENMDLDTEMKIVRQMGVENMVRAAYLTERISELRKGSPAKLKDFENKLNESELITKDVMIQMSYFANVLKIEEDIERMKKEGVSDQEIKNKLGIPELWSKGEKYPYNK